MAPFLIPVWLLLPRVRSFRTPQAFHRCASPRTWSLRFEPDDFALSSLPREGGPNQDWPFRDAASLLWREQHPEGHEQVMIDFTVKRKLTRPIPLFYEVD